MHKPRTDRPKPKREPTPITPSTIEELALGYLNRFDCTESKLKRHLLDKLARRIGGEVPVEVARQVDALIVRYRSNGVLNDARYAQSAVRRWSERGTSERVIAGKLNARGLARPVVDQVMGERKASEPQAELASARALVRRRRLGPYRPEAERPLHFRKDLAALARAGFSFDTARRALEDA